MKSTICRILLVLCLSVLLFSGCTSAQPDSGSLRLGGAGDLYFLSVVIKEKFQNDAAIPVVSMKPSASSIEELKRGKNDAVLLGRQPTAEELKGLNDRVVAYDAVCIIIDENSYLGGVVMSGDHGVVKSPGLRRLSSEELKSIFSRQGLTFSEGYFEGNFSIDPGSFLLTMPEYAWVPAKTNLVSNFNFQAGSFDTQTVIYSGLNLSEQELLANWNSFTSQRYSIEEEILALEYAAFEYGQQYAPQVFRFKLGFASRRAMTVAPLHVPVRVVAVDGIDPLANPEAVYDGSYLFTRKIHVLTKENNPEGVDRLVDYLLSESGQKLLAEAGYLPLNQTTPIKEQ